MKAKQKQANSNRCQLLMALKCLYSPTPDPRRDTKWSLDPEEEIISQQAWDRLIRKSDSPVGCERGGGQGKCFAGSPTSIASTLRGFLGVKTTLLHQGQTVNSWYAGLWGLQPCLPYPLSWTPVLYIMLIP